MLGVNVLSAEVEGVDGLVGGDVLAVEEDGLEAGTVGELEVLGDIPLVLGVKTYLVEGYTCGRIELSVPSVGYCEGLGGRVEGIDY